MPRGQSGLGLRGVIDNLLDHLLFLSRQAKIKQSETTWSRRSNSLHQSWWFDRRQRVICINRWDLALWLHCNAVVSREQGTIRQFEVLFFHRGTWIWLRGWVKGIAFWKTPLTQRVFGGYKVSFLAHYITSILKVCVNRPSLHIVQNVIPYIKYHKVKATL